MCNKPLDIPGLRPLTPEELKIVQGYEERMRRVVIPEIVEQDRENSERVAKSRNWIVD